MLPLRINQAPNRGYESVGPDEGDIERSEFHRSRCFSTSIASSSSSGAALRRNDRPGGRGAAVPTAAYAAREGWAVPIEARDRLGPVIDRDERMLDTLIEISWIFERLRDPEVRRTMGRLVTVDQGARVAGLPVSALLARLNAVLGM